MNLITSCESGDYYLALTVSLLGGALRLQAQGLPALPYVINGACQLECCRLGEWSTSFSRLPLYTVPGGRAAAHDTIPARTSFTADSTVVVVQRFGIAVPDEPVPQQYRESPALGAGDTVYLVRYEGEDWFTGIVRGQQHKVYAFWSGRPGMSRPPGTRTYGRVVKDLETEWWVHVRWSGDHVGWINMTHVSSVHGPDACSE